MPHDIDQFQLQTFVLFDQLLFPFQDIDCCGGQEDRVCRIRCPPCANEMILACVADLSSGDDNG